MSDRKFLSRPGFHKLCTDLQNRREQLTTNRPMYQHYCDEMSEKLGEHVSTGALTEAMEATGVTWTSPANVSQKYVKFQKMEADLQTLCTGVGKLEARLLQMSRLVVHLYEKLGERPPDGIALPIFPKPAASPGSTGNQNRF